MSLANIITLARVLLTPFLILSLIKAMDNDFFRYIGAGILLIIGLSDILDGYMAKRRNEVTPLGKYFDPIADKLVVISLCLLLTSPFWPQPSLPSWLAVMIIGREVVILSGGLALSLVFGQWQPCPNMLGKLNNFFQLVMFGATILANIVPLSLLVVFWWVAGLSTLSSGLSYLWLGLGLTGKALKSTAGGPA